VFGFGENIPASGVGAANTGDERRFGESAIDARARLVEDENFMLGVV
jgi:hypothetical protein